MVSVLVDSTQSQSAVVDAYDNTVLYTDWFLDRLIESAKLLDIPATLVFFPDHGEDIELLDGATGHGGPTYTRHAFEIPALVWVNEAYRRAHPDKVAAMLANSSHEIRSHNLFYTEADLMGITWPGWSAAQSFASEEFIPDDAMKHIAGGVLVDRR
jgi:glucan phosphoethanolaminetransferase (alkaline phosphatase superfamily)